MSPESKLENSNPEQRREAEIRRHVRRLAEFYRHLTVYLVVCSLLWALNLWNYARIDKSVPWYAYWAIYPTLGWGIGVFFHGLSVTRFGSWFSTE